jgi:hypothetical protein
MAYGLVDKVLESPKELPDSKAKDASKGSDDAKKSDE